MFVFPDPAINPKFTLGEKTWQWNGYYWDIVKEEIVVPSQGISFFQQDTLPSGAKLGDRWLNTKNMNEFIYVQISSSPDVYQWMDLSGDYAGDSIS